MLSAVDCTVISTDGEGHTGCTEDSHFKPEFNSLPRMQLMQRRLLKRFLCSDRFVLFCPIVKRLAFLYLSMDRSQSPEPSEKKECLPSSERHSEDVGTRCNEGRILV